MKHKYAKFYALNHRLDGPRLNQLCGSRVRGKFAESSAVSESLSLMISLSRAANLRSAVPEKI